MKIGNVKTPNEFSLAPMAGLNCTAFRLICKENGAGLIFTQMYDVNKIHNKSSEEIEKLLNIHPSEHPVVVQLIGRDIKKINKSARLVEPFCDIINLNAGCIEKEYLERKCGGALEPEKMVKILRSLKDAVNIPVTVKIRIGPDAQTINAVKVCQDVEKYVDCIIIHGRTVEQKYAGKANWTVIKQVKEKVNVPIIGNGDIKDSETAYRRLRESGCDGVMIGREAKYKPWIFSGKKLNNNEIRKQILHFIDLYEKYENRNSLNEIKDECYRLSRDFKTKKDKRKLKKLGSVKEIKEYIQEW